MYLGTLVMNQGGMDSRNIEIVKGVNLWHVMIFTSGSRREGHRREGNCGSNATHPDEQRGVDENVPPSNIDPS